MLEKEDLFVTEPDERSTEHKADHGDNIGYKNPPKHTQLRKGVSGNQSGRPRKDHPAQHHDVPAIFRKVFATEVKANVGGKTQYINGTEAAFLQLRAKVSAGDLPAIRIYLDLCKKFGIAEPRVNDQLQGLFDALMAGPVGTPGDDKS
jgi:hypothetical protein